MTSRLPVIALGAAGLAVAVSLTAAVVVLTRGDRGAGHGSAEGAVAGSAAAVPPLVDQSVTAVDAIRLADEVEVVVDAGLPTGVRVKDVELAKTLGLGEDDVILALSGRAVTRENDVADVMSRAASLRVTTLYVEIERAGARVLVRWQLDGSLLDARRDARIARRTTQGGAGVFGLGPPTSGGLKNPFTSPDPLKALLDTIEKVDDTHVRVPKATFEALLSSSIAFSKGARVIPAMKSGVIDGYKLYAIRPGSVYGRLGLNNGDTVHSINGAELGEVDDVVALLVDAKNKTTTFQLEITRRGAPLTLHIDIVK